mmetsp:Transcript_28534/g.66377  ORF Transcript_28534/g.66377 Transcript_28534/m.66377 type:complete len:103 (-) Transcript_28534:302-610(-)
MASSQLPANPTAQPTTIPNDAINTAQSQVGETYSTGVKVIVVPKSEQDGHPEVESNPITHEQHSITAAGKMDGQQYQHPKTTRPSKRQAIEWTTMKWLEESQ